MSKDLHIAMYQDSGECPPGTVLLSYAAGHLDAATQHRVERHLLDCELCAEALEGLGTATPAEVTAATDELKARVHDRIGENGRKRRGAWLWLSSAAAVALLVTVTYFMTREPDPQQIFSDSFKPFPAPPVAEAPEMMPADGVTIADSMVTLTDAQTSPASSKKSAGTPAPAPAPIGSATGTKSTATMPNPQNMGGYPQSGTRSGGGSSGGGSSGTGTVTTAPAAPSNMNSYPQSATRSAGSSSGAGTVTTAPASPGSIQPSSVPMPTTRSTEDYVQPDADMNAQSERADHVTAMDDEEESVTLSEISIQESKRDARDTRARKTEPASAKEKGSSAANTQFDAMPSAPGALQDSMVTNALTEGLNAYRQEQYTTAIPLLNEWLGKHPLDHGARFYLAQALMATGQYDAAGGHLQKIVNDPPNSMLEDAAWYLALVRIRQENTDAARSLLIRLQKDSARYRERARKLLKELD